MVDVYAVRWTPEAINDLRLIKEYITVASGREEVLHVVSGIRKKANGIGIFPTKHARELSLNNDNIRYAIQWSYKIIFEIKRNKVRILAIFHTAQNPNRLSNILQDGIN